MYMYMYQRSKPLTLFRLTPLYPCKIDVSECNRLIVMLFAVAGTWRTHLTAGEQFFAKVSKEVPLNLAATLVVNPQTAYRMLKDFVHLEPGKQCDTQWLYS